MAKAKPAKILSERMATMSPDELKAAQMALDVMDARGKEPSETDREQMKLSLERNRGRGERVSALVANLPVPDEADRLQTWIGEPHNDKRGWLIRVQDAFGTHSDDFANQQLHYLANMARDNATGGVKGQVMNGMLAAVDGTRPRDEIESMLAVQMATTHALAMDCLMRTHRVDTIPQMEANGNLATKLLRTYTAQVEALSRLRRGGEQKVEVKHVHVHEGGQAIVGNVSGGGGSARTGEQPHGPSFGCDGAKVLAFEPGSPLWGTEQGREPVSVTSEEREGPLPTARRG